MIDELQLCVQWIKDIVEEEKLTVTDGEILTASVELLKVVQKAQKTNDYGR